MVRVLAKWSLSERTGKRWGNTRERTQEPAVSQGALEDVVRFNAIHEEGRLGAYLLDALPHHLFPYICDGVCACVRMCQACISGLGSQLYL